MNRSPTVQHRRAQGHGTRLVVVALVNLDLWRRLAGRCFLDGLSFRLGSGRPGGSRLDDLGGRGLSQPSPSLRRCSSGCAIRIRLPLGIAMFVPAFSILAFVNGGRSGTIPTGGGREGSMRFTVVVPSQLIGFVFVNRAGVGNLFRDAEFVQLVDDLARLHFQLPRQLIDANLTHIEAFRLTAFTAVQIATLRAR